MGVSHSLLAGDRGALLTVVILIITGRSGGRFVGCLSSHPPLGRCGGGRAGNGVIIT